MKNCRFWLMTEVATCFFVALSPVQAETAGAFEKGLESLGSSPSLAQMEKEMDAALGGLSTGKVNPSAVPVALAKSDDSMEMGKRVPASLVAELSGLSRDSGLNFPEQFQVQVAQMQPSGRPMPPPPTGPQPLFPNPEITIQPSGASGAGPTNPSILTPRVPVAPVRSRAVPPPVGDLAISNINASFDSVDLGRQGQAIVPRLVLREAPAREVLQVLTRFAGMNLIFTDGGGNEGTPTPGTPPGGQAAPTTGKSTITLDIENETVQEVFNSVLMASGLKASRRGNTIFAGSSLRPSARNIITRTIRLNQASAESVASTLATQGAEVNILFQENEEVQLAQNAPPRVIKKPPTLTPLTVQKPANDSSVLILEGLVVSTDPRMNTVTLVGEPRNVELATSMIQQMDARRRQVAVNVKIVDVNLNNIQDYNSSFSFGINDSYFIQDEGTAVMRFGQTAPVREVDFNSEIGRASNPPLIENPFIDSNTFIDTNTPIRFTTPDGLSDLFYYGRSPINAQNPLLPGITEISVQGDTGVDITSELPTYFQYPKQFQAQILAQIQSGNAKILTDPTLIVQEGEGAQVKLTESVVTSVDTQVDPLSGVRTTTPVLEDVGLTLNVVVDRIDDNGFISVRVNPTIASPGGQVEFSSGIGAVNTLTLINKRELSSGLVRLRDDQTFILSGIISEIQQSTTTKVPILGDIPVLGALFRSSTDETDRSEVIIMLTPKIIPDSTEVQFGYKYSPDKETADYLRQKGFPVQVQP